MIDGQANPPCLVEPMDPAVSVLFPKIFRLVSEYISLFTFCLGFLLLANEKVLSALC